MELAAKNKCTGCGGCASQCAKDCINMLRDSEGFYHPVIDASKCVECGKCREVCQEMLPYSVPPIESATFYCAWSLNDEYRKAGSSGGVFGVIAQWVMSRGGVVFGAAFDTDGRSVRHVSTDEVELEALKKSKYVESYTGTIFGKVKEALKADRWVLFCGAPCQVIGLRKFVQGLDQKFILCDFLCHGVPSSKTFGYYVKAIEKKYHRPVAEVAFRSKKLGWKLHCMKISFKSGADYVKTYYTDPFYRLFLNNFGLRPSCYECDRVTRGHADITLGDFWGVTRYKKIDDTDEGISFLAIHTPKGEQVLGETLDKLVVTKLPWDAVKYAYSKKKSSLQTQNKRDEFFNALNKDELDLWNNHFLPSPSLKDKLREGIIKFSFLRNLIYSPKK